MFNVLKFKELRKRKKMSVDEISKEIGVSTSTIYQYQSGRADPSQEVLEKIATLFGVDISELLKKSGESAESPYKDVLVSELKQKSDFLLKENKRLWELIHFFTKGQAINGDLGKWLGSLKNACETPVIPLRRVA